MAALMSQRRKVWEDVAQRLGVGVLSGTLAGLVTGLGARLAMRIVAIVIGLFPGFTPGGTLLILAVGTVLGVAPGMVYAVVSRRLPGPAILRGATFGVLLFVIVEVYPLIVQSSFTEPDIHPASLRWGVFGALSVIYGLALGAAEALISRRLSLPRRDWSHDDRYVLLALWGLGATVIFLATLMSAELGIHVLGV